MARSRAKAKSNKKQKKQEGSERDGLDADEYFVGMSLDTTPVRTRPDAQPRLRESSRSKGQCYPERRDPLGERVSAPASASPTA